MDKAKFMWACREGGQAVEGALRTLHRHYAGALLHEAWQVLRDREAAQDLLQDTLLKVWRRCTGFRGESELYPWLKSMLRHGAIDRLRRLQPEVALDDDPALEAEVEAALRASGAGTAEEPPAQLDASRLEAVYRRCAARFAAEQPQAAAVIRWIAEDDLGPAEIAELVQRSPGATREFISQCRKKARIYFHEWYLLASSRPRDLVEGSEK